MLQEKVKISNMQAIFLVSNAITPTATLVLPTVALAAAGQDAWISILLSWTAGLCMVLLYASISRQNPGVPFLTLVEYRMGRVVSIIVGIALAQYYMTTSALIVKEFADFLSDEMLKSTPLLVLAGICLLVSMYAVSLGIEVIARVSFIVMMGSLTFLMIGIVMEFNLFEYRFLYPIGEASFQQLVRGGMNASGWMSEASILLLLSPYLIKPAHARKIGVIGVLFAGMQIFLITLVVIFSFGPELPKMMKYPAFATTEAIKYGAFVERVDLIFFSAWIATIYVKLCIFLFGTVHCFVHVFRIRSEKPFLWGLGVLILLTALYSWQSSAQFGQFQHYVPTPYLFTMNVLIPFALWVGMQWKKQKPLGSEGA